MNLETVRRLAVALASAPGRITTRLVHPELVSFGMFAALSRLQRIGRIADVDAVIDVGANIGQFAFMASRIWPDLPIYSFEPDPLLFAQLEQTRERFQIKGRSYCLAAASNDGARDFYRYSSPAENSLLRRGDVSSLETCRVETARLDDIEVLRSAHAPYLKVDVQGAEADVIKGAPALLQCAAYVQVEVAFHSRYQGASDPGNILLLLHEAGFRFSEILDHLRSGSGEIQEMDWLFVRR